MSTPTVWKPDVPPLARGAYVHYKGDVYDVTKVEHDSGNETNGRWLVSYTSRTSGVDCARPLSEFTDTVEHEGSTVPRFARSEADDVRRCAFCGKTSLEVAVLITGAEAMICGQCIVDAVGPLAHHAVKP